MEHIQSNGVTLAIRHWGDRARPTVLLVHGYPDNHRVWLPVAERLAADFHVIAYDVRGAGSSGIPPRTRDYRLNVLAGDLATVAAAVSPDEPVHLVGHDWGSIQCWEAVTEPRLRGHFASFTSISGPCLDHAALRMRGAGGGGLRDTLAQLRRSWYIAAFHLPFLAPLSWRLGLGRRWPAMMRRREGVTVPDDPARTRDGVHGIKLYRANFMPRLLKPRDRRTDVPVQILVPLRDPFVGPELSRNLERWVPRLTRIEVDAGHWLPLSHPDAVAARVRDFIVGLAERTAAA
jgi:pimeloyl-ACP methyl ester carboxylesterase